MTGSQLPPDEYSEKLKTAAVLLAQLYTQQKVDLTKPIDAPSSGSGKSRRESKARVKVDFEGIRARVIDQMASLEADRRAAQTELREAMNEGNIPVDETITALDSEILTTEHEKSLLKAAAEDPSAANFAESFVTKQARIKSASPYGDSPCWKLYSVIVKAGSDLRQEHLALQLMLEMQRVWQQNDCPIYLYCYRILVASDEAGLIETIPDSISIHSIKKSGYANRQNGDLKGVTYSLYDYFIETHGEPGSESFLAAQNCFLNSLAGYCIISYILQVKDRHNGNILMKKSGHLVHIDFGFVLSNSPGTHTFSNRRLCWI
jgi:hypothetical protein